MDNVGFYKHLLHELAALITNDYILLDLPYFTNVGDVLIWQATLDVLKKINHKCLYSASIETYVKPQIAKDVIVVFMGGGNFGDLWFRHQTFRHRVLTDFPDNPILQLPQSVFFESDKNLNDDIGFFCTHKGSVTICLRDKQSYDFIEQKYPDVRTLLMPDMVLGFDIKKYANFTNGHGAVLVKRKDKERVEISEDLTDKTAVADWPMMDKPDSVLGIILRAMRLVQKIDRSDKGCTRKKIEDFFYKNIIKKHIIKKGIKFLQPYRTIYSTRLHAGILAWLLKKDVYLYDNSYGKIKGVYDLWLKDQENVHMN